MTRILFATYEFHPTTWGGCGVLLRHATDLLLSRGHEVVLLLDVPKAYFDRFVEQDHATLSVPERCTPYHADSLCDDFPWSSDEIGSQSVWKSLRFAHALARVEERVELDFVEFFEYCGVGYHALVEKRFGLRAPRPTLGIRVHNSVELIDLHEGTKTIDRECANLYGLERAALAHAETILFPSKEYARHYYFERYGIPEFATTISEPPTADFGRRPEHAIDERREIQFFGRIFEFKGVETFVRAGLLLLEKRPDLDLDFVLIGNDSHDGPGGTSYSDYLKKTIPSRFRKRFVFTGHLDQERVLERLGRARFMVFPNRFESFCYAAREAHHAGVPMIVSDIPAFRNFLEEGRDALFFDGSCVDLTRTMLRLIEAPSLLDMRRDEPPREVEPLGDCYETSVALRPIPTDTGTPVDLLVVVLVPPSATTDHVRSTLDALEAGLRETDRVVLAFDHDDARTRHDGTIVSWLGRPRQLQDVTGRPLDSSSIPTLDALQILCAGDLPSPDFLPLCRGALERNPTLGFSGTWSRDPRGRLFSDCFDITLEMYPFEKRSRLTRCLFRTPRGDLLTEAFDPRAGIYGEIGAIWQAEEEWGPGCLLPRALLRTSGVEEIESSPAQLAFLALSFASPGRRERLGLLSLIESDSLRNDDPASSRTEARRPGPEEAERIAAECLNGRSLARLTWEKLRGKLAAGLGRWHPARLFEKQGE